MIIERPNELKRIREIPKWTLIYGRRKTGKTFLITNFIKSDEYFFVKNDRGILSNKSETLTYETFIEILKRSLENNQTVIVDEFHRLGNDFFDFLHFTKKQGKLILISSTLFLSKKLISSRSSLLGLFAEIPIGLISMEDTLKSTQELKVSKKEWLELAILMREPLAIDYFNEKQPIRETIAKIVLSSMKTIPALVGEIFVEETREISAVYEGIFRGIAVGKVSSGDISSYLFSKKIIKKDDPSLIQQYLTNLVSFGILRRIKLLNKNRFIYKLVSPLSRIYYYLDEKYNISERNPSEKEILQIINELMPRLVEDSVREALAEKFGLGESVIQAGDFDIDGCLLKFNKPEIVLEVKWGTLQQGDIFHIASNLDKISAPRKILFVPDKSFFKSPTPFEIFDPSDLL